MSLKNVIISGANGFIGKNLVSSLRRQNIKLVALDVKFDDVLTSDNGVQYVSGTFTDHIKYTIENY